MQQVKKIFLAGSLIILFSASGVSQTDMNRQAISVMSHLAAKYKHAGNLSFDVSFKYSSDQKPEFFLDSLSGSFKMNDSLYWYTLSNTECVFDSHLLMMLFKEDKIMYLAQPGTLIRSASPLAMIDSLLRNRKDMECQVHNGDVYTEISIEFPPSSNYKRIEYYIDNKTGYLSSMKTRVRAAELYDPSVKTIINQNSYAIVETSYFNYRRDNFNKSVFDLTRYFRKEGDRFVCVAPFQAYKIFLGTPNL